MRVQRWTHCIHTESKSIKKSPVLSDLVQAHPRNFFFLWSLWQFCWTCMKWFVMDNMLFDSMLWIKLMLWLHARVCCRFGEGYTLIVRVCADQADMCVVESFVRDTFPGSTLKEKHHNTLQYQIPQGEGTLAHIFSQLTKHQQMLQVEDYSVSQTTLDQVKHTPDVWGLDLWFKHEKKITQKRKYRHARVIQHSSLII